jgi:hypothetical protein
MSFRGTVCGLLDQDHDIDLGHLQLLRAGRMTVQPNVGDPVHMAELGLLLLPRPLAHTLSADIGESMALLCATIDLGHRGGSPIAMALPAIVALPFATLPSPRCTLLSNCCSASSMAPPVDARRGWIGSSSTSSSCCFATRSKQDRPPRACWPA